MTREEAVRRLAALADEIERGLREAETLARAHDVDFSLQIDTDGGFSAIFHGKSKGPQEDWDVPDEEPPVMYGPYGYHTEPYWEAGNEGYWQSSSRHC